MLHSLAFFQFRGSNSALGQKNDLKDIFNDRKEYIMKVLVCTHTELALTRVRKPKEIDEAKAVAEIKKGLKKKFGKKK